MTENEKKEKVGTDDRIHGHNPFYRAKEGRFKAFEWVEKGPKEVLSNFLSHHIDLDSKDNEDKIKDHQGHIVPQNMLNDVLIKWAEDMVEHCKNEDEVRQYVHNDLALYSVYQYGLRFEMPMFNFEEKGLERVDGFFSIIMWNPVNICRAPEDEHRGGAPGDDIDDKVYKYLEKSPDEVVQDWSNALNELIANKKDYEKLEKYIRICCHALNMQMNMGVGYYSFPWKKVSCEGKDILVPVTNPNE